jgi:Helix-turn-helix.
MNEVRSLKEYLELTRKTQRELARELGISLTWLQLLIHGVARPGTKLAKEISKKTGIPVECLLFPEDYDKEK